MNLCSIMEKNGSDKGYVNTQGWHNYTVYYNSIFNKIKDEKLRVFELGLGTHNENILSHMSKNFTPGGSLYGWCEYFPNALIFGADIDREILFQTNRIKTFYCDQTNPLIINDMWNNDLLKENFDIIIEDGLHEFNANVCFFENSIHKLKKGGYYIIEDVKTCFISKYYNKIQEWKHKYNFCTFDLIKLEHPTNDKDNNLIVIQKVADPVYKKSINIAFYSNQLSERGTEVAMYDYAYYNETLLDNKSIIIYSKNSGNTNERVVKKFKHRFNVYSVENKIDLENIIISEKIDLLYMIKSGENDGILSLNCKNVVHCVFTSKQPHGDIYAPIAPWVEDKAFVPHMINLPKTNENLRKQLNIPENAVVFGRHGGYTTFDIPYVYDVINAVTQKYRNIYFLFLNTKPFSRNPNIIYLNMTENILEKVKFINTCDAMIHARSDGEVFPLSIGEFSYLNKPIFTTYSTMHNGHLHLLKDNCYIYTSPEGLYKKIIEFKPKTWDWNMYKEYTPENVMQIFKSVFINPLQHHFIERDQNVKLALLGDINIKTSLETVDISEATHVIFTKPFVIYAGSKAVFIYLNCNNNFNLVKNLLSYGYIVTDTNQKNIDYINEITNYQYYNKLFNLEFLLKNLMYI